MTEEKIAAKAGQLRVTYGNLNRFQKESFVFEYAARLELRIEALEGKGGEKTFEDWWNEIGSDLFHKGASKYDLALTAWNAATVNK